MVCLNGNHRLAKLKIFAYLLIQSVSAGSNTGETPKGSNKSLVSHLSK